MKKILFSIFLIFLIGFIFYKASDIFALGEPCCDVDWAYDPVTNQCVGPGEFNYRNINCVPGEVCTGTGRGICAATSPVPTRPPEEAKEYDPCWDPENNEVIQACWECLGGKQNEHDENRENLATDSWTALGCIPNNPRKFVAWLLARAIGIGGGIAFLLMIWGGFQVITAAGDPDRLNAGKEVITSAIAGLLLIILSLFLLQLIGVDILGLGEVGFKIGQ